MNKPKYVYAISVENTGLSSTTDISKIDISFSSDLYWVEEVYLKKAVNSTLLPLKSWENLNYNVIFTVNLPEIIERNTTLQLIIIIIKNPNKPIEYSTSKESQFINFKIQNYFEHSNNPITGFLLIIFSLILLSKVK